MSVNPSPSYSVLIHSVTIISAGLSKQNSNIIFLFLCMRETDSTQKLFSCQCLSLKDFVRGCPAGQI